MTVSNAINKLFFTESEDYPLYLDCLSSNEFYEEQEEVSKAKKTLAEAGIPLTEEILTKKRERALNVVPEPIPFIRRAFRAVETNELPF